MRLAHNNIIGIAALLLLVGSPLRALEPKAFNRKEAEDAAIISARMFDVSEYGAEACHRTADSLFRAGEASGNYMVQLFALSLMNNTFQVEGNPGQAEKTALQAMDIALHNDNLSQYFTSYALYCSLVMDRNSAEAVILGKQVIADAQRYDFPPGAISGYQIIGEANLYYRDDFYEASQAFENALRLANENPGSEVNRLKLYVELAKSYNEDRQFDSAREALKGAEALARSDRDTMQIRLAQLDLAYNTQAEAGEYTHLHDLIFSDPLSESLFLEDTRLFYHIRKLIVNRQFTEALREIPRLEIPKDQYLMKTDIFKQTGDFQDFLRANDSLEYIRDSITHHLRMEELVAMDGQLHNIELKAQASRARSQLILTVGALLAFISLMAIILLAIYQHRRNRHLREVMELNLKLQQANEVKSVFIRNMTHELHTPLNVINGFSSILSDEDTDLDNDLARDAIQTIHANVKQLTSIVDDIVLLTGYESATEAPAMIEINPWEIIDSAVNAILLPPDSRVALHRENLLPEGYLLLTNGQMLKHLLHNLLTNAVKFTSEGEIRVTAQVVEGHFRLSVADTGSGIPPEKEEAVFDRFVKLNEFVPGTGLGLTLCRTISKQLGGDLFIDHTYTQRGTRFIFQV